MGSAFFSPVVSLNLLTIELYIPWSFTGCAGLKKRPKNICGLQILAFLLSLCREPCSLG